MIVLSNGSQESPAAKNERKILANMRPFEGKNRVLCIALALLATFVAHVATPVGPHEFHFVHLFLRKLLLVPVLLGAIWFGLRGALAVAVAAAGLFAIHVLVNWSGFAAENVNQAGEIASIFIVAVMSGVLVDREKSAIQEVAKTHEGALTALVGALDAREHDTKSHSVRVQAYALHLGKLMGLSHTELLQLGQGALLHDIGKIGVPDDILLKPGRLTDDEWKLMRAHAEIGAEILDTVPFLAPAADVARSHHERYDGTGYPGRLRGEEIPLGARIFAVVDVFDALTTDRPYHRKLSFNEAREQIQKAAGSHFDPTVVRIFSQVSLGIWCRLAEESELKVTTKTQ